MRSAAAVRALSIALAFSSVLLCLPIAHADGPKAGPLTVRVERLHSSSGQVGCSLYNGPRGFPTDAVAALQQRWCVIDLHSSTCTFDALAEGTYAIACFHDENHNGRLDRNFLGVPTEGTVVSNHAKGTLGPPKFDDAKFVWRAEPAEMELRVSY